MKTKLRAMFDGRREMWKIMKKTNNGSGGWARFGSGWYWDKPECEEKIRRIVQADPDQYEID